MSYEGVLTPPAPDVGQGSHSDGGSRASLTPLQRKRIERCTRLTQLTPSFEFRGWKLQEFAKRIADAIRRRLAAQGDESGGIPSLSYFFMDRVGALVEREAATIDSCGLYGDPRDQLEAKTIERISLPMLLLARSIEDGSSRTSYESIQDADQGPSSDLGYRFKREDHFTGLFDQFERELFAQDVLMTKGDDWSAVRWDYLRWVACRERSAWDDFRPEEGSSVVTVYYDGPSDIASTSAAYVAIWSFLASLGLDQVETLAVRQGSRWEAFKAGWSRFFGRDEVQENIKNGVRDAFDTATAKAGEKHKADAEADKIMVEKSLLEREKELRADPQVQDADRRTRLAKARSAEAQAEVDEQKAIQERLRTIGQAQELAQKSPGVLQELLLKRLIASLQIEGEVQGGIAASGHHVMELEGGKVTRYMERG